MGFPGLIIDGTAFVGGGDEPLPPSESYEDMVAGVGDRKTSRDRDFDRHIVSTRRVEWLNVVSKAGLTILSTFIYRTIKRA